MLGLEAPGDDEHPEWGSLYLSRGEEVGQHRPVFTGDVFRHSEGGSLIQVLQHPCAIRMDGVNLAARLLVAPVKPGSKLRPSKWTTGNYKVMPLPELLAEGGNHYISSFHLPETVDSTALAAENRVATLSPIGVNLLLQRWIHHNSRVIVPTFQIHESIEDQFEEADLVEEWSEEWEELGLPLADAGKAAHDWFREDSGSGTTWQGLLHEAQTRSRVRAAMRAKLRSMRAG